MRQSVRFVLSGLILLAIGPALAEESRPIWQIPLSGLVNSLERPLFMRSRRRSIPPPSLARSDLPSTADAEPGLVMLGIMLGPDGLALAVVQDEKSRTTKRLHVGEVYDGWELVAIEQRQVTLQRAGRRVAVRMPAPLLNAERPAGAPSPSTSSPMPFLPRPAAP